MNTRPVHMSACEWALSLHPLYFGFDLSASTAVLRFSQGIADQYVHGGGQELLQIHEVSRVCPKTYFSDRKRYYRSHVIASVQSKAAAEALKDRILSHCLKTERNVHTAIDEVAAPIEKAIREQAGLELQSFLPHLFGGRQHG